nr:sensor domain-containing diguanylate cyclase [Lysinibacillus timonensis]
MLNTIANKLAHGLYMVQDSRFLWVNHSFVEIFGYVEEEVLVMDYYHLVYPDDRKKLKTSLSPLTTGEIEHFDIEIRGVKKDKGIINISLSIKRVTFNDKISYIGSVIDITSRKKLETELLASQNRYKILVENSQVGMMVHQMGIIEYANPMAMQIFGAKEKKEIIGQSIYDFIHPKFKDKVSERINSIINFGKNVPPMVQKICRLDGNEIDVEISAVPIMLNDAPAVELMIWDVTEKKKEEEIILYRAYYDTLLDLPNRNKFELDLAEELSKDRTFTLLYLNLEGLKDVSEQYGQRSGEIVLIKISSRLSGLLDQEGLIYRMGEYEFTVVMPGQTDDVKLKTLAEKINKIVQQPVYIHSTTVQVCVNIGVVTYPSDGVDMNMLLQHARLAVNHAKYTQSVYERYDG